MHADELEIEASDVDTPQQQLQKELRQPCILEFDTNRYPIREALLSIMRAETDPELDGGPFPTSDLSLMHTYTEHRCSQHDIDKAGNEMGAYQTKWNRNRDKQGEIYKGRSQAPDSPEYVHFESIYTALIRDVCGPSMGGGRVLYQRAPTFRTYLAGVQRPMGKMHTDEDYHHQPSELNFWMPVSDHVGGNNSLWVESWPGRGDFHPLELRYGQIYRGWLNQCRHYTEINDTAHTRVSIDFRAVNAASGGHDPGFHRGVMRGAKARFQKVFDAGGFYEVMEIA